MDDKQILDLYWERSEAAISETSKKYGKYCRYIAFNILHNDEDSEEYTLTIDPRWHVMYSNREFALIDWEKRREFGRNQDMAKSLQRLVATSAEVVQRFSLEYLKGRAQSAGRMRDFRDALEKAMRELERLGIIAGGRIEKSTRGKEQAVWTKLGGGDAE